MWLRPYWGTGQVVQDIGQKVVYPVWRGAVRALMAPEELLHCIAGQHFHHKLRMRRGLGGTVCSSTHISLPPGSCSLQITMLPLKHGQYKPPQTLLWSATQPCQHNPLLLTTSLYSLSPTPACCWLFCFHGAAAVPPLPATGQWQASLGGEATPALGIQPGAVTAVLHQTWNLRFSLQVRWGERTTGMSDIQEEPATTCTEGRALKIGSISKTGRSVTRSKPCKSKGEVEEKVINVSSGVASLLWN